MAIAEITSTIGKYYNDKIVTAVVGIETDVSRVDQIGKELAGENNVEDVFIVTGEYDILIKVRFPDYEALQKFLVGRLSKITGVKGSKTMMVVSIKKDMGQTMGE